MNVKKILFGEKPLDIEAPEHQEKRKKWQEAGARFAKWCRFDKAFQWIKTKAEAHPKRFFAIVFTVIGLLLMQSIASLTIAVKNASAQHSAVELQRQRLEKAMEERKTHKLELIKNSEKNETDSEPQTTEP
ncbi:MAG: hypothetical protein LIP09_09870 [Bacteroidales bacterium]|nr:hypothetical protein [Bacteroidales bacterium]